ncbi:glycosyltransferase [Paenibacillus sp. LMG 31461]|uniref:Glycosyltransferase n=1 Tax=Paenibacillus plantarum TaxID=2654975 RepID=A0ABX1XE71_9BACL|nr:glycosyltransferase [Paenibacillus plantarum]NOU66734.1 glycosyltransferase [Paenibacillus plantarum]
MKILEMTTFLRGGAGVFTTRLSQMFKSHGHDVQVISSGHVEQLVDWEELLSDLANSQIAHHTLNFFKREPNIFWSEVEKLTTLIQQEQFDVIHAHAGVPAMAAYTAKVSCKANIPIIATFHSWSKDRPAWMNTADTWAFNQCDKVFFDSLEYMRFGRTFGLHTEHDVIYPGLLINPTPYLANKQSYRSRLLQELNLPSEAVLISNLAEITERKGQLDLIHAMKAIREQVQHAYLLLIGECRNEEYQMQIDQALDAHQLRDHVKFMGWVKDPHEIVAATDLFIFPSYSEGLGMAIVEAATMEVPTIFSSVEGMKDIEDILDKDCLGTFQPGQIESIAEQAIAVINMPAERRSILVKQGSRTLQHSFSFESTVKKYETAMTSLVATTSHNK